MSEKVAIIGGGFTGLTAAYRLAEAGIDVTIYEAGNELGGLASGFELLGQPAEKAYHFLYRTDEHMLGLVDELELQDQLTYHESSVSTYYDDTLYPMMTPIDLIKFKPLSFVNRIRAGVTVLYLQRVKNWEKLTKITAIDWLRKYAGDQVTDVIWQPLLIGKFDRYYDKVTMAWLWGRVKQRVDSRNPGEKAEKLGYFDGGFATLVGTLEGRVRKHGGTIRTGTMVSALRHNEATDSVEVTVEGSAPETFDRVLATVPSHILAKLIEDRRDTAPEYFEQLESIDYLSAALLVFATNQEISPYYWHNVNTPDAPFVVFLSLTALIGTESYGGKHVYYIGDYVPPEHKYMSASDDEMRDHWYSELGKMFPKFDRSKIVEDHVFKFNNSQHIVDVGFEEKLADHQTPCPGVLLANFSQIFPMDRGTNYAVKDGIDMSDRILAELKSRNAV